MVLKSLQIHTRREKSGGTQHIMSPSSEKVGRHVPRVPHQIAPMLTGSSYVYGDNEHLENHTKKLFSFQTHILLRAVLFKI